MVGAVPGARRFEAVLDAIEAAEGWLISRVVPGTIILGEVGDSEAGVRQVQRR